MLDSSLPLTASDYDEFGNPAENRAVYDHLISYAPYDNIGAYEYPAVYISCGSDDFRSPLWSVLKYAKRFRQRVSTPRRTKEIVPKNLLLQVIDSGHFGEASIDSAVREKSQYLAFLEFFVAKGVNLDLVNDDNNDITDS
jgi:oligopeptidase B